MALWSGDLLQKIGKIQPESASRKPRIYGHPPAFLEREKKSVILLML